MATNNQERAFTVTNTILLDGLKNPESRTVWQLFDERYRPLLVSYGRRAFNLEPADADDAAQATLVAFYNAYRAGKYDRNKGRLRHWLFGIARNKFRAVAEKVRRHREVQMIDPSRGTGFLNRIPDDDQLEAKWDEEWRRAMYRQCLEEVRHRVRPKTILAFEMVVAEKLSAQQVADRLNMSCNAVYRAKHSVLQRIRTLLPSVEETW